MQTTDYEFKWTHRNRDQIEITVLAGLVEMLVSKVYGIHKEAWGTNPQEIFVNSSQNTYLAAAEVFHPVLGITFQGVNVQEKVNWDGCKGERAQQ